jgi:hypothetical protein
MLAEYMLNYQYKFFNLLKKYDFLAPFGARMRGVNRAKASCAF